MVHDPISSTSLMSLSPSASDSSSCAGFSPTLLPPRDIELLDYIDRSNSGSPTFASLVSSAPVNETMSLETAKPTPSALSSNATHQKGQTGMNGGRWTEQEHQSFLAGLRLYGREWKKVAGKIKTRTSAQIRSHAQKYFAKLARDDEMRKHCGLSMVTSRSGGYFSDGGSSIAQNSGDDDVDPPVLSRQMIRARSTDQAKGTPDIVVASMSSTVDEATAETTKKRSRATQARFGSQLGVSSPISTYPYKLYKRAIDATRVARLPSQEELLAKASPNLRHRLSCLIEAELCALQVLSSYAMLQQQDHVSAPREKVKRQGRPHKLATAITATTGSATASSLGLSMLSTEQIRSASSIY